MVARISPIQVYSTPSVDTVTAAKQLVVDRAQFEPSHGAFRTGAEANRYQAQLEAIQRREDNEFSLFIRGSLKARGLSDLYKILSALPRNIARLTQKETALAQKELIKGLAGLSQEDKRRLLMGRDLVARFLSPEYAALMQQQENEPALARDEAHQLLIAEAKAKLNHAIKYKPKPAGGKNGAVFVLDAFAEEGREKIAVFKPTQKSFDFIKWLKQFFGQARLLNRKKAEFEQKSEVVAKELAQSLGFNTTPQSKMAQLGSDQGAFLLFLGNDYTPASNVLSKIKPNSELSEAEIITLQKAFVFNFLTGDLDGHSDNYLMRVAPRPDGKVDVLDVRFVDFGNAFPICHPGTLGYGNQFAWGDLEVSKLPFHPEVLAFIRAMREEYLETFITTTDRDFLIDEARTQLVQRFNILKYYAGTEESMPVDSPRPLGSHHRILSPRDLAQLHYEQDYRRFPTDKLGFIREEGEMLVVDFAKK